ncbi:MAG: ATP-grasp enzyme [Cyanobacteria bacterium P01_H01_bin.119]
MINPTDLRTAPNGANRADLSSKHSPKPSPKPSKVKIIVQNVLALAALLLVLPLNGAVVFAALLAGILSKARSPKTPNGDAKTVLISGGKMTKALQLARLFHAAGHRVILIEAHKYWLVGHRFSNAVSRFYTVPEPTSSAYGQALQAIVMAEGVDVYVPVCSPASSYFDAQASRMLSSHCEVMHVGPGQIAQLDDKYQFAQAAERLGLSVPKTYKITHPQQVLAFDFSQEKRPYILKSIAYDAIRRLDLTRLPCPTPAATAAFVRSLPISEQNPWILQEFIAGKEYCTHSTLRQGELRVYCCCESSAFQVNYAPVTKPKIEAWVRQFAAGLQLTGQASFDFIESPDGEVYAIECNPRTHSAITLFYRQPQVANAYLSDQPLASPVYPRSQNRPTYWLYHEVWRRVTHLSRPRIALKHLNTIWQGKEAIFDWRDPLPFLMVHHWQIPLLLLRDLRQLRGWIRIDFNIGKLVQLGGD